MALDVDYLNKINRVLLPRRVRRFLRPAIARALQVANKRLKMAARAKDQAALISAKEKLNQWRLREALDDLELLIDRRPLHLKALHLSADIHAKLGESHKARRACILALRNNRLDLEAIRCLKAIGAKHRPRISSVAWEIRKAPRSADSYLRASQYLLEIGDPETALKHAITGIEFANEIDNAKRRARISQALQFEAGRALEAIDDFAGAINWYSQIRADPAIHPKSASHHARCLLELGKADEAESLIRPASAYPQGPIPFDGMLISVYYGQDRIADAHRLYRNRATTRAVSEYFRCPHANNVSLKSGRHIMDDTLFIAEGGPGDEIRASSTYAELTSYVQTAAFSCDPRLHSLLSRSYPAIKFVPTQRYRGEFLQEGIKERDLLTDRRLYTSVSDGLIRLADSKSLVMTVLDTLVETRANREDFRRNPGRLKADPLLVQEWSRRITHDRPNIGISWRSLLLSTQRNRHYLQASDLLPLGKINANFWILQPAIMKDEYRLLKSHLHARLPDIDLQNDFEGQSALIANLDAVIAPLTTTAELAGMLGVRTLIFGRTHIASWRKNADGTDAWYENARFLTGDPIQDIPTLLTSISNELARLQ